MKDKFIQWLKLEWRDINCDYRYLVNWECEHFCLFYWMLNYENLQEAKIIIWKQWNLWEHFYIKDKWKYIDLTIWQFWDKYPEIYIWDKLLEWITELEIYPLKQYIDKQRAFIFYKDPNTILIN